MLRVARSPVVLTMLVLATLVLGACSKKDDSPKGLCERGCRKLLGCMKAADSEIEACIESCTPAPPDKAKLEQLEGMTCEALMANGGVLGGGAGPTGDVDPIAPQAPQAPQAPAGNGCTADCRTCVGDGTSCWAAAGGTNGIPCDPCCCAPGGPAPTWR